jgi:YbgC/YbaW family acyl-CoA thioester hydrolase
MARILLELPEIFHFKTILPVRVGDLNYGGHVGNDAIVSFLHEARMQFFASHGFTELQLGGVGSIMADCAVVYKGEAFYADRLQAEVAVSSCSRVGFDLFYRLSVIDTNKPIAEAKTGIVCFDYTQRKVVSVPQEVRTIFDNHPPLLKN